MTHSGNDKPMRIYFVGSHATGKTTMTRWVSRRYGLPMITEVARAVPRRARDQLRHAAHRYGARRGYQRRVFERQIAIERMQDKGFVSGPRVPTTWPICRRARHGPRRHHGRRQRHRSAQLHGWVSNGLVFFVRPHRSLLKEDGVRAGVDWDSVVRIDGMVKLLLEQFRIRYLPIDTPSMQERIRTVEFVLAPGSTAAAAASRHRSLPASPGCRHLLKQHSRALAASPPSPLSEAIPAIAAGRVLLSFPGCPGRRGQGVPAVRP